MGKQLAVLLFIIVLIFVAVGFVLEKRLEQTQFILEDLTLTSMPTMSSANKTAIISNELLASIERFTAATTPPERRIAEQEVKDNLDQTQYQANKAGTNDTQRHLLNVIKTEVESLTALIENRLNLADLINKKLNALWVLQVGSEALSDNKSNLTPSDINSKMQWQLAFLQTIADAHDIVRLKQFSELRKIRLTTKRRLDKLESITDSFSPYLKNQVKPFNDRLKNILLGEDSLIVQQIDFLRSTSLYKGREHLIRNMISDYSNIVNRLSLNENMNLKEKADKLASDMKIQKKWLIGSFLLLAAIIGAILYIYIHMIRRLRLLTQKIHTMTVDHSPHRSNKNEIDQLFQAFEQFSATIKAQTARLKDLSLTDSLTNIANRRAFDQRFQREIAVEQNLSILLIDIDYFKQYNDTYGHLCGDIALQKIALIIAQCSPDKNTFTARYGGEEFVVLQPNISKQEAKDFAQNIILATRTANLEHSTSKVSNIVTVSIGIMTRESSATGINRADINRDMLIQQADMALYYSKDQGRDQYTHIDDIVRS